MRMVLVWAGVGLAAGTVLLGGCGSGRGGTPKVVVTTGIAGSIVRSVAGPDVPVEQVIPNGASPHEFQASARDRLRLEQATLVVGFGNHLEGGLHLDRLDSPVFAIGRHTGRLARIEVPGEERGGPDPHVWMDPLRIARAMPALAAALGRALPGRRAAIRANAARFVARLRALDRRIRTILDVIPAARRKLVTSHDALGYFASRYRIPVVAAPFGVAPGAEPSAARLQRVVETVRRDHLPAVFVQREDDPRIIRRVADQTGARVVDDLAVEGLGPGPARTYLGALEFDARRIAEALGR